MSVDYQKFYKEKYETTINYLTDRVHNLGEKNNEQSIIIDRQSKELAKAKEEFREFKSKLVPQVEIDRINNSPLPPWENAKELNLEVHRLNDKLKLIKSVIEL